MAKRKLKWNARGIRKSLHANLGVIFDKHVKHEFVDRDVDATMKTMGKEPYVHIVATFRGWRGNKGVYEFYKNHFVGKMPPDTNVTKISRTVGKDQVVEELILSFTYDREIDFMLPGVKQIGEYVELPHVVVMRFRDGNRTETKLGGKTWIVCA